MTQSMSRVAKCIDNGPMEGFWGILKREKYYGMRYTDRKALVDKGICGIYAVVTEAYNNADTTLSFKLKFVNQPTLA